MMETNGNYCFVYISSGLMGLRNTEALWISGVCLLVFEFKFSIPASPTFYNLSGGGLHILDSLSMASPKPASLKLQSQEQLEMLTKCSLVHQVNVLDCTVKCGCSLG